MVKKFRPKRQDSTSDNSSEMPDQEKPAIHPAPDDLSVSLRSEMLPGSDIRPDMRRFRSFRLKPSTIRAVLFLLIIFGIGWLLYFGPGRPALETVLAGLTTKIQSEATATPVLPAEVQAIQTGTLAPATASTRTPTQRVISSPTATGILITPTIEPTATPSDECVDVLSITLADVGKTLCIRGVILNYEERPSGFIVAFSAQKGSMYWVSYDLVWEPAQEGLCVEATGEVMQIANSPVLVFGYRNLPDICDTP